MTTAGPRALGLDVVAEAATHDREGLVEAVKLAASPPFITLLTDFGLEDDFVGTCHGVIKRIAPDAQVIDITHGIAPTNVLQGALVLANTLPYMPAGVHLAVVDPGVGGDRKPLALRAATDAYVGPDNGLLLVAAERLGGVEAAVELTEPRLPAGAGREDLPRPRHLLAGGGHLAAGVELEALGPAGRPSDELVRLELPPEIGTRRLRAPPSSTSTGSGTSSST